MKKILITALILSTCWAELSAQTAQDALRYSRIFYNGTSRFMSTAGAFGAVGADFSTLATNPAGLGLYRSAEITFTPYFFSTYNSSEYNGYFSKDYKLNFALANIGYVYTFYTGKPGKTGGVKSISVGFGMNRQNDFNDRLYIQGPNHTSSLLTSFTNILNTGAILNPNEIRTNYPFDIGLAYDCGLIFYDSTQDDYHCDMPNGGVFQNKAIKTWGSINEFDISLAGNINDRVYIGLTIGIPNIRYYYQSIYKEEDTGDSIPYFQSMRYDYSYETHGTGVNFKVGIIVRPADWIRIGGAIHTPTWYPNMYDYYASSMSAIYDSVLNYPVQYSPSGMYEYQLMTPFRFIGSLAFFVGPHGLISGEYEFVNYNQARFRAPGDPFSDVNSAITGDYKAPLNIRVGTEWRIFMFRVRGGFGYYGSPDKIGNIGNRYTVNGGFGVFIKRFFADFAYQFSRSDAKSYLYDPTLVNPADLTIRTHSVTATFGFKF
ncbi:MAG: hypothetical protein D4R67_00525 [Bacteroidetes bacterium]|nr:MAG: hypothetical protein D4R67_00525 [Bacteroidota bacterium]